MQLYPTCNRSDAGCHILADSKDLRLYYSLFSFRSPVHICSLSLLASLVRLQSGLVGNEGCVAPPGCSYLTGQQVEVAAPCVRSGTGCCFQVLLEIEASR